MTKHGYRYHRLYNIWALMKKRCYNKNNKQYQSYGGRGIIMCDDWKNDFETFLKWSFSNGYADSLSIDRIDNDGIYEPANCRWTTHSVQNRNRGLQSNNRSGHKGVSWLDKKQKWIARTYVNGRRKYLGIFKTIEEAEAALNAASVTGYANRDMHQSNQSNQ